MKENTCLALLELDFLSSPIVLAQPDGDEETLKEMVELAGPEHCSLPEQDRIFDDYPEGLHKRKCAL